MGFFIFAVIDSDDSVIAKLCGAITDIAPIFSSSNSLTIIFKTDNSRNATGFRASWTSVDNVGDNIIKSPNYPLLYTINQNKVKLFDIINKLKGLKVARKRLD